MGSILSNLCTPTAESVLPLLNCLLEKLETDKLYKEPEINRYAR